MPPEEESLQQFPAPWSEFLAELDAALEAPVELHCLGGFVVCAQYGLPRPTNDIDYVAAIPRQAIAELDRLAGVESPRARRYGLYLQFVAVAALPENYEQRLEELFPGSFRNLRLFALDPYDLALSKLERNSPKDREDVSYLARTVPLDPRILRERYQQELRPNLLARHSWHDQTLELWLEAYFA